MRNLNNNKRVKEVKISKKKVKNVEINFKSAAYADDISVICEKSYECIQKNFYEYERLTQRSGLELNADKTEILSLDSKEKDQITFRYNDKSFEISTVEKIKICGLFYCTDLDEEYRLNVSEKIKKLTMEGKVLIVKTFGLSQIIYNMQSYGFNDAELITIERIIFKFLWSTKDNQNGIDRIK